MSVSVLGCGTKVVSFDSVLSSRLCPFHSCCPTRAFCAQLCSTAVKALLLPLCLLFPARSLCWAGSRACLPCCGCALRRQVSVWLCTQLRGDLGFWTGRLSNHAMLCLGFPITDELKIKVRRAIQQRVLFSEYESVHQRTVFQCHELMQT